MNSSSLFPTLIHILLPRIPFLLFCIAGVVIGLVQLNSHRKPAALVLIASALLVLGVVVSLGSTLFTVGHVQAGGSHVEVATIVGALSIVQGLLSTTSYGVLIYAAFAGRNAPKATSPDFRPPL